MVPLVTSAKVRDRRCLTFSNQMATISGITAHTVPMDDTSQVPAAPLRKLSLILVSAPRLMSVAS